MFVSDYLYFPNNLKDIKDHIWAYRISLKIFFQLMVTVFKEGATFRIGRVLAQTQLLVTLGLNKY